MTLADSDSMLVSEHASKGCLARLTCILVPYHNRGGSALVFERSIIWVPTCLLTRPPCRKPVPAAESLTTGNKQSKPCVSLRKIWQMTASD